MTPMPHSQTDTQISKDRAPYKCKSGALVTQFEHYLKLLLKWCFLQLYIFHHVLNSVGLFYQAQALHESFNVDQPPPGREE